MQQTDLGQRDQAQIKRAIPENALSCKNACAPGRIRISRPPRTGLRHYLHKLAVTRHVGPHSPSLNLLAIAGEYYGRSHAHRTTIGAPGDDLLPHDRRR